MTEAELMERKKDANTRTKEHRKMYMQAGVHPTALHIPEQYKKGFQGLSAYLTGREILSKIDTGCETTIANFSEVHPRPGNAHIHLLEAKAKPEAGKQHEKDTAALQRVMDQIQLTKRSAKDAEQAGNVDRLSVLYAREFALTLMARGIGLMLDTPEEMRPYFKVEDL